jgi:hypothetical protein
MSRGDQSGVGVPLGTGACAGFWFFLPFTQFRVGDVGISELMGLCAVASVLLIGSLKVLRACILIAGCHLVMTLMTFLHAVAGYPLVESSFRDVVAVSYSVVAAIAIVSLMTTSRQALKVSAYAFMWSIVGHSLLLVSAVVGWGPQRVWWEEGVLEMEASESITDLASLVPRFVGLSENPNQLAFFLVFGMFFIATLVHFRMVSASPFLRALVYASGVIVVLATQSDAGLLAMGVGLALVAIRRLLRVGGAVKAMAVYVMACCSALMFWAAWNWGLGDDGGGGRLPLWIAAQSVIDASHGIGLGYGIHIYTDLGWMEAHSTPIDFVISAGVLGGFFLVALCVVYLVQFFVVDGDWRFIPTFVALSFLLTYSALRHPIFWVALILPYVIQAALCQVHTANAISKVSGPFPRRSARCADHKEGRA